MRYFKIEHYILHMYNCLFIYIYLYLIFMKKIGILEVFWKPQSYRENQKLYRENQGLYRENPGLYRENQGLYRENQGLYRENQGLYRENQGLYRETRGYVEITKNTPKNQENTINYSQMIENIPGSSTLFTKHAKKCYNFIYNCSYNV